MFLWLKIIHLISQFESHLNYLKWMKWREKRKNDKINIWRDERDKWTEIVFFFGSIHPFNHSFSIEFFKFFVSQQSSILQSALYDVYCCFGLLHCVFNVFFFQSFFEQMNWSLRNETKRMLKIDSHWSMGSYP